MPGIKFNPVSSASSDACGHPLPAEGFWERPVWAAGVEALAVWAVEALPPFPARALSVSPFPRS